MTHKPTWMDRSLAVVGTVLVWLPIAFTLLISLVFLFRTGQLRVDWLMPAEMFLGYLAGAVMLLLVAFALKIQRREILGSVVIALVGIAGSQGLAVVLGLASGAEPAEGWRIALVLSLLVVYTVAVVSTGIVGLRISRTVLR